MTKTSTIERLKILAAQRNKINNQADHNLQLELRTAMERIATQNRLIESLEEMIRQLRTEQEDREWMLQDGDWPSISEEE